MDIVVTDRNKVFYLGGSLDYRSDQISDLIFEWDVVTKTMSRKPKLLLPLTDFGSCYLSGFIYVVGGWAK